MRRVLPPLVLVLVTAAALVFIYKDKIWPKPAGETVDAGGGGGGRGMGGGGGGRRARSDPNRVVPILAEAAKSANVPVYLQGVGTVQAFNTATVRAQVSGRLIAVNYREGQDVKKGDVLAQIDPVTYKAAYDQAMAKKAMTEAQLANARQDLKRYEGLAKTDYATKQQADTQSATVAQLEAQVRQDQAAIDSAKANLDYTNIVAPIDGRTSIREIDIGNLVTSNDSSGIVVITQIKPISVLFTLPETAVGELIAAHARGKVALTASVGGETVGEGVLEVIDNRIDQATGTVRLKGTFANETLSLWPGQFVNIRLHLKTLENATVVPAAAVQQGTAGRYVYVVQPDNTVKLTNVTVTQEDEKTAVIATGIAAGTQIATAGFGSLRDKAKISLDSGNDGGKGGEGKGKGGGDGKRGDGQSAQSGTDQAAQDRAERRRKRREQEGQTAPDAAKPAAASPQDQSGKAP